MRPQFNNEGPTLYPCGLLSNLIIVTNELFDTAKSSGGIYQLWTFVWATNDLGKFVLFAIIDVLGFVLSINESNYFLFLVQNI